MVQVVPTTGSVRVARWAAAALHERGHATLLASRMRDTASHTRLFHSHKHLVAAIGLLWVMASCSGCLGPAGIRLTRCHYNKTLNRLAQAAMRQENSRLRQLLDYEFEDSDGAIRRVRLLEVQQR